MAIDHFSIAAREDLDFETERAEAISRIPSYGSKDYDCAALSAGTPSSNTFDGSRHGTRIFFCVGVESLAFSGCEVLQQGPELRIVRQLRRPSSLIGRPTAT
jgi:hypothetical protein